MHETRKIPLISSDRQEKPMCDGLTRLCCCLVPMISAIALFSALGYRIARPKEMKINWPTIDDFLEEDPFNATDPDDADRWPNDGEGLELMILNALDTKWHPYFEAAVNDWNSGWPDALSLSTAIISKDTECTPVSGKMKVCNGNYGDTRWRGICNTLISDGYIYSSVAKMNEFYLSQGTSSRKQYTMCHELGHGLGLSHSDESFWNRDLGNCMDYTMNPGANKHPDSSNFEFLAELYGEIPYSNNSAVQVTSGGDENTVSGWEMPEWLISSFQTVSEELKNHRSNSQEGDGNWRLLHSSPYAQVHHIDLGGNFSIRVNMLLA